MYKYLLFDLDGTLTDPKEGICKSVQYALKKLNIDEPDIDKLEPFIGPPLKDSFMKFYGLDEEKAQLAIDYYRERFSAVGLYENEIYPGIPELLGKLKNSGVKLAIASSKPTVFVKKILEHFEIDGFFDVVVGSELDGTRTKKEEAVEEALLSLYYGDRHKDKNLNGCDSKKAETAMIGDRCFDIEGAKCHTITGIGVGYGYAAKGELKKAGSDYIAGSVKKLEEYLLGNDKNEEKVNKAQDVKNDKETGKKAADSIFVKNGQIPEGSFFRAIYVLTPFALYYLVNMAVISVCLVIANQRGLALEVKNLHKGYYSILASLICGGAMPLFYHKSDRISLKTGLFIIPTIVSGAALALGLNLITGYILDLFPTGREMMENATARSEISFVAGVIYYVIISPLSEEMIFRYMIHGRIKKILGGGIAVVFTALFFGLYHGNLVQGIYAFIMGLLMSIIYEKTESLVAPVLFHVSANAMIYLGPKLPDAYRSLLEGPAAAVLSMILGIFGIIYILSLKNIRKE